MLTIHIRRGHVVAGILALAILFGIRLASAWTNPTQFPPNGNLSLPSAQWTASSTAIYSSNSGNVGIGITNPGQKLSVAGTIESTSGGFKFPDGTVQSTAAKPLAVQVFTSSGTWTRTTGATVAIIEVVGGGGGGGGAEATGAGELSAASGGGGGGYARKRLNVTNIASSTITVGAGGAGGAAGLNVGGNGGTSSWVDGTNTISATGGAGGDSGAKSSVYAMVANGPGAGGSGSGGDFNSKGSGGGWGIRFQTEDQVSGGTGGNSFLGGGAFQTAGGGGITGGNYGGGGSGGAAGTSAAAQVGGLGAPGIVIVTEY